MRQVDLDKRPGRPITVCGVKWKWHVGKGSVVAYSEHGERRCGQMWSIKGVTPDAWERGQHKKTKDGALRPIEVSVWLSPKTPAQYGGDGVYNLISFGQKVNRMWMARKDAKKRNADRKAKGLESRWHWSGKA